jgi:peptide/nickel transport system substrate-binding protein
MENRFGVKDFVVFILLAAVIVMVSLCMFQYDRQWDVINQANAKLNEQTKDLASIRRLLEQGGAPIGGNAAKTNTDLTAGFERILASHDKPDYASGDSIVGTFPSPAPKLTPLISQDSLAATIHGYVLDSLITQDPNTLEFLPRLAIAWKVSDDLMTIDFTMRHGVTFSDGEPVTADDVVFTMQTVMSPDIEAPGLQTYFERFDKVEKTGPDTVRFKFKVPYFKSFEMVGGLPILSKKFYGQFDAKTLNESTGLLLGSGPYRLADPTTWKPEPGKPIELVRNERYWGVAPAASRMIWKVISNPSARQTAFRNGETDTLNPTPEQFNGLLADTSLVARTQHFNLRIPNIGYQYIGWNEIIDGKPTPFADKRVRQAMTMLLDREAICKDIMRGYAEVNSSCFSALTGQADPAVKPWPFDPDRAIKLLADAGYHKENDTLIGPDGQPFRFKLTYPPNSPVRTQIQSFTKDALARAGIIVDPDPQEWSVLLKRNKEKKLQAVVLGWTGGIEDDPYQIFSTSAIAGVGDNTISYSNPELDKTMELARATKDLSQRMQYWHAVHRILHEDQPYTFLFISHELTFIDGRFKGAEPTKTGLCSPTEWYVPAASQKYKEQ